ncbi:unnamed protein product [Anisakis simplex]|uniref:Rab-GAP TBC domain-containing protein n=1 Tax=Anisakis simplex TaxID=6269 RepID=A0A158PPR6_ANISI|nr:unnamed protein product [Anisakis simplex]
MKYYKLRIALETDQDRRYRHHTTTLLEPAPLATVLENLPLVYNTEARSLHRLASDTNDSSSSDAVNIKQPFKRGHIRRSSYESAQIKLNYNRFGSHYPQTAKARANSLNRALDIGGGGAGVPMLIDYSSGKSKAEQISNGFEKVIRTQSGAAAALRRDFGSSLSSSSSSFSSPFRGVKRSQIGGYDADGLGLGSAFGGSNVDCDGINTPSDKDSSTPYDYSCTVKDGADETRLQEQQQTATDSSSSLSFVTSSGNGKDAADRRHFEVEHLDGGRADLATQTKHRAEPRMVDERLVSTRTQSQATPLSVSFANDSDNDKCTDKEVDNADKESVNFFVVGSKKTKMKANDDDDECKNNAEAMIRSKSDFMVVDGSGELSLPADSGETITATNTIDSAIGESMSSKRSSLDRKSQMSSTVDWISDISTDYSAKGDLFADGCDEAVANYYSCVHDEDDCWRLDDCSYAECHSDGGKVGKFAGIFGNKIPSSKNQQEQQPKNVATDANVVSTMGLILEDRPSNLPAKSEEEEAKHRAQYLELIEQARKREAKEAKERKKAADLKRRLEDQAAAACRQWSETILPKWDEMKNSKRCREMWWQGIPSKVRGRVWSLVIGNELNLTEDLYNICCCRALERISAAEHGGDSTCQREGDDSTEVMSKRVNSTEGGGALKRAPSCTPSSSSSGSCSNEGRLKEAVCESGDVKNGDRDRDRDRGRDVNARKKASRREQFSEQSELAVNHESSVELIHLDVSRTFPTLGIFQQGGPYYDLLLRLLGAYVCYRPDVGYVQSMSFVAAVFLLQMDSPYEAFVAFANLLNRPLQLAFFRLRQPEMTEYFIAYDQYFDQELHKLHTHFDELDVRPDLYLIEWVYTLYAKSLPLDVTCRVWDMFLRDGEEFLFKTALGILRLYERQLLEMDFEGVVQFLTHLPETMSSAELFRNIEPFMRSYASTAETSKCKRRFLQILSDVNERINPRSCLSSADLVCGYYCGAVGRASHRRSVANLTKCGLDSGDNASGKVSNSDDKCLSQLSSNMQTMKLSKSLSGFLGDLLKPPLPAHVTNTINNNNNNNNNNTCRSSIRRSPTCPLTAITSTNNNNNAEKISVSSNKTGSFLCLI